MVVGVYSFDVPGANAVLTVSGDGLTFGATSLQLNAFPGVNPPLNLLSVPVHVAANATPGLRSFVVQDGTGWSYANGFIEIAPAFPDYNFDALDDFFQRQFFARWTAPESAPSADPDQDGFSNATEHMAGSSPIDASSVLRVESVRLDATGATVTWGSAPGRRYQLYRRSPIDSGRGWRSVGSVVVATGSKSQLLDTTATGVQQYYRVQAIP
jgi:hypothetical protein